jgi:hypothetical protein
LYWMALQKQPPWSWNAVVGKVAIDVFFERWCLLCGGQEVNNFPQGPIFGRLTMIGGKPIASLGSQNCVYAWKAVCCVNSLPRLSLNKSYILSSKP